MRIKYIVLALLFAPLCACQHEAQEPKVGAPKVAEPVVVEPSAAPVPAPVDQATPPAANEAPVSAPAQQTSEPAKMAAQAASEAPQPSVAEKPLQPAPVEAIAEPVAPAPAAEAPEAVAPPEPVVSEQEFMQLAKKNNCLACHATGKKLVGPSFMDVAAKYRGDAGAEAWLIEKIAKGGKGVWGVMVMTPSPNIGEADRRRMAKYILSLK